MRFPYRTPTLDNLDLNSRKNVMRERLINEEIVVYNTMNDYKGKPKITLKSKNLT